MIKATPAYCREFQCIAGTCGHSCCVSWEIDIDEVTLEKYRCLDGPIGRRFQECIECEPYPHFRLTEEERCPFLNRENLCDIIIELGEDHLCQICRDHPRFYNWYADRMEWGLGLCCEEAARLLVKTDYPLQLKEEPMDETDDECDELYVDLKNRRLEILKQLQDGNRTLEKMLRSGEITDGEKLCDDFTDLVDVVLKLECLDEKWHSTLLKLKANPQWMGLDYLSETEHDGRCVMQYIIYRYYISWGITRWDEMFPLHLGVLLVELMNGLYHMSISEEGILSEERRVDWIRTLSSEIEYSEENMELLAEVL